MRNVIEHVLAILIAQVIVVIVLFYLHIPEMNLQDKLWQVSDPRLIEASNLEESRRSAIQSER
jgi:hypothetical protein